MLHRALLDGNPQGLDRAVERARVSGDGLALFLRGLHRHAGFCLVGDGEPPPTIVVDAVADVASILEERQAEDAVRACLCAAGSYLMRHDTEAPREDWFSGGEPQPSFVPVASLQDACAAGDLGELGRSLALLSRAVRTREYLNELLLEAVAADPSPAGNHLAHAMAAVKGMQGLDEAAAVPILYRLAEKIAARPIPLPADPEPGEGPPAWDLCFRATVADSSHAPEGDWLYLAHAFQAARYVQLRDRGFRSALFARLKERWPDAGRAVDTPAAGGSVAARDLAAEPEEMLHDLIVASIASLERGDGTPLLAVNAARWGAHLLGPSGAESIAARLRARLVVLGAGSGRGA